MNGFFTLIRRVSLRHVFERRLRAFLTVSGIGAGVALVVSIAIINSTLLNSVRASVRNLAGAAELEVAGVDQTGLPERAVRDISRVPGVDHAVPVVRVTSRIKGPGGEARVLVLGVTPDLARLFPTGLGELGDVRLSGTFGVRGDGLLLADDVARRIGVSVGREVPVITPRGAAIVEITGVVAGAGVEFLNGGEIGAMALPAAQRTFDKARRVDSIYVVTEPDAPVGVVEASLRERLGDVATIGPPGDRARGFERTFESLALLTSMAGTVALFVALFVVYNTMSITVAERRREISMALAVGARRRQVFGAFLTEAAILGTAASVGGIVLGIGLARWLVERALENYKLLPITAAGPVVVQPNHLLLGLASGLGVALVGAFVPARRVMTVAPVESLRPSVPYDWAGGRGVLNRRVLVVVSVVAVLAGFATAVMALLSDKTIVATAALVIALAGVTGLLPVIIPLVVQSVHPLLSRVFGTVGRLAGDALLKNPGRTSVTVGALVLTMGMVLGVGTTLQSYESQFERSANGWFGPPLYVQSDSFTGLQADQPLDAGFERTLATVPGVEAVYPWRYSSINIAGEQVVAYIVPVAEAARAGTIDTLSDPGANDDEVRRALGRGDVVISHYMAKHRGLAVGDELAVSTPSGRRELRVGALFYDLASFDSMYMEHSLYQRYWDDDKTDNFAIIPARDADVEVLKTALEQAVTQADMPARVLTRSQIVGELLENVRGLFSIAQGIQLAALIVAALTIANTMFTTILERRWEFGLQQAVGMGRRQLGATVLLEAIAIGIIGGAGATVLGMLLGFIMIGAMEAQFALVVPFEMPWVLMGVAIVSGAALAALVSLYPRRLAVRVPIVECLRYE